MPDAVVLPGGRYPPAAPLTWYAGDVVVAIEAFLDAIGWPD
jgi:hypothetical protein